VSGAARLYGVGVGPGDPELMTVKACRVIGEAAVIAYPQLGTAPSTARQIAARWLKAGQREIVMRVPLGGGAAGAAAYDAAAGEIAEALEGGASVAILCEGDPLIYGSFIALWERLSPRFACEIVPGISSILAGPARLAMPLVRGSDCLSVVPGTLDDAALERRIAGDGSVAIVKVGRHADRLKALIGRLGLMQRAHYIERATLASERQMPLAELGAGEAPYFSMIVIAGRRPDCRERP
jgi:precorrin-2/cobalt-factor-2 C20-methyltransferase